MWMNFINPSKIDSDMEDHNKLSDSTNKKNFIKFCSEVEFADNFNKIGKKNKFI